jgi:4a-hydroxytetrahydrobiopterin dehydratase
MEKLNQSSCEACRKDSPMVTDDQADHLLSLLDHWDMKQRNGIKQLEKTFKFENFVTAMEFANRVGDAAEQEDHHPTIVVEWGKVKVTWWTHKIGGLHMNDFTMAAKTDQIHSQS